MSGASKDYGFGNKNQWNRWFWNRVDELLMVDKWDARVMYLAGPRDHDRTMALRHGFRPENLLAIDRDKNNVQRIKDAGGLAIDADLKLVVENWSKDPVHVFIADYCCGLTPEVADTLTLLFQKPEFAECVCVVNMLRGRDTNHWSEIPVNLPLLESPATAWKWMQSGSFFPDRIKARKHRGEALFWEVIGRAFFTAASVMEFRTRDFYNTCNLFLNHCCLPQFNNYKSESDGGAVSCFDSVVFRNPSLYLFSASIANANQFSGGSFASIKSDIPTAPLTDRSITQRLTALRAVRTRKLTHA